MVMVTGPTFSRRRCGAEGDVRGYRTRLSEDTRCTGCSDTKHAGEMVFIVHLVNKQEDVFCITCWFSTEVQAEHRKGETR